MATSGLAKANTCKGYEVDSSVAAINREEARYRDIQNDEFYAQNYFKMRQSNREVRGLRALEYGPRSTADRLRAYAASGVPGRLGEHELDPLGVVLWPNLLKRDLFRAERIEIDRLMYSRSVSDSGEGSENYREIRHLLAAMADKLTGAIHEMSPSEYVNAKRFLERLEYEARFPVHPAVMLSMR